MSKDEHERLVLRVSGMVAFVAACDLVPGQEVSNKGVRACLTRIARLTSTWTLTLTLTAVVEVDVAVDVEPIVDLHLDHRS
jgi:hypothetical protein